MSRGIAANPAKQLDESQISEVTDPLGIVRACSSQQSSLIERKRFASEKALRRH